ncbi:hypothetical protein COJ96_25245 [Bacillus sp. AFS073361]|nr:hypothetical protein COJ96_25245 [Bacillus sp. AFS073361]
MNCLGDRQKSKEYFFLRFEKIKARNLARVIDDYIWNRSNFNVEDAATNDGIGYKKKGSIKFATLTTARQRCLILHVGNKEDSRGLQMQDEIDTMLKRKFDRKEYEYKKYPHETYIRLEWVDNFEQIKPFINQAYYLR